MTFHRTLTVLAVLMLAGCSTIPSAPDGHLLEREAIAGTDNPPPAPLVIDQGHDKQGANASSNANMHIGNGVFIRRLPPAAADRTGGTNKGQSGNGKTGVVFNFENQPVEAVVKAVLGDFLKQNYAIGPEVKGVITFSTAKPVPPKDALPILETMLAWTHNALIRQGDHYLVLTAKNAVAGYLTPAMGARSPGAGLSARMYPLQYISAPEMQKLLKPFAPEEAFLLVDPTRNLLIMAGTPSQLNNYQRTIATFDVDWLKGMSVGVFTLKHANVEQLMPQLQKLFGKDGTTPLAGMIRFLPIQRTNAIVVITPQPDYLREVQQWINRIDAGGGNQPQLYVYNVKNMLATSLAHYLNQIYSGGSIGSMGAQGGAVAPGLTAATLNNAGAGLNAGGVGGVGVDGQPGAPLAGTGSSDNAENVRPPALNTVTGGAGGMSFNTRTGVRITSVTANNQLLVHCRPSQWADIKSAIQRLDVVPLQVQIETRILEVQLTGEFSFGVQWYLEGLIGGHPDGNGGYVPGQPGNKQQYAIGQGGSLFNSLGDSFFYSFLNTNLQVAVHAMESSGNTKVLSEPSLVVMNNQTARIQVGEQVPVNQTYFAPGLGSSLGNGGIGTLGNVEYKDTGVILAVRPRVNPGGLVYLSINQVVSKPGIKDEFGNFPIQKRELATQIAVQSGQTVLLGGLIQQDEGGVDKGVPWLNRVPILGRLFGGTNRHRNRTELLILITPRVIRSSNDARDITLQYQRQFESLAPLRADKTDNNP